MEESPDTNGNTESERLAALVRKLEEECANLHLALARAEEERDLYLKAIYDHARTGFREFEDIDIDWLKANSAGPVELLE